MHATIKFLDQWFLLHCPLVWQLRLHWYLPLAALWCLIMLGGWTGWMAAEPARWLGVDPGITRSPGQVTEQVVLQAGETIAWIVSLGGSLWWLLRIRIHNRWHERSPAPRMGLWWEYLWAATFFTLLFAPALTQELLYSRIIQRHWANADTTAYSNAARHVDIWEQLVAPHNTVRLVELAQAQESKAEVADDDQERMLLPLQSLQWLVQGNEHAIANELTRYDEAMRAQGYARVGASSAPEQARQLLAAYSASLQSPLAQEWQKYKEDHQNRPRTAQKDEIRYDPCHTNKQYSYGVAKNPRSCFDIYLKTPPSFWLSSLPHLTSKGSKHIATVLQWSHSRYGTALPYLLDSHMQHAIITKTTPWDQRRTLLFAMSFGFFVALTLIIARLMSPLQMVGWGAAMVLTWPSFMLLDLILSSKLEYTLWLSAIGLFVVAWIRIGVLRRPWAGTVLLGVGVMLSLVGLTILWEKILIATTPLEPTDIDRWIRLLMQTPAMALSVAALVAVLSPLWRRCHGLPER